MDVENEVTKQPIFNIRSVAERTGITPETLRAWERRYGIPSPYRNEHGYRFYTEEEIATLKWLKKQRESGMTIGQAVKLIAQLRKSGQDPIALPGGEWFALGGEQVPTEQLQHSLTEALSEVDGSTATKILDTAFAQHPLDSVLLDVVTPALVEIGDAWHAGELPVAIEHFASNHCRNYLVQRMKVYDDEGKKGRIIAACAPGEWHDIGLLMITMLLQRRNWNVTYLGANLSFERFGEILVQIRPHLLLFSSTSPDTAEALLELTKLTEQLPEPKPLIGLGGLAFSLDPTLANRIPGTLLGPRADDAVRQIEQILAPFV